HASTDLTGALAAPDALNAQGSITLDGGAAELGAIHATGQIDGPLMRFAPAGDLSLTWRGARLEQLLAAAQRAGVALPQPLSGASGSGAVQLSGTARAGPGGVTLHLAPELAAVDVSDLGFGAMHLEEAAAGLSWEQSSGDLTLTKLHARGRIATSPIGPL